jgi:hypothetical protein
MSAKHAKDRSGEQGVDILDKRRVRPSFRQIPVQGAGRVWIVDAAEESFHRSPRGPHQFCRAAPKHPDSVAIVSQKLADPLHRVLFTAGLAIIVVDD